MISAITKVVDDLLQQNISLNLVDVLNRRFRSTEVRSIHGGIGTILSEVLLSSRKAEHGILPLPTGRVIVAAVLLFLEQAGKQFEVDTASILSLTGRCTLFSSLALLPFSPDYCRDSVARRSPFPSQHHPQSCCQYHTIIPNLQPIRQSTTAIPSYYSHPPTPRLILSLLHLPAILP